MVVVPAARLWRQALFIILTRYSLIPCGYIAHKVSSAKKPPGDMSPEDMADAESDAALEASLKEVNAKLGGAKPGEEAKLRGGYGHAKVG